MASPLDSQTLEIPCPHCGHKLRETIGKLQTNPKLTCRACQSVIAINATDLRRKIASVEKQLADFARKIGRLGK